VVLLPVLVAALLCTALVPIVQGLERRGWRTLPATWVAFGGFVLVVVLAAVLVVPPTAAELGNVGDSVREGSQQVEDWLVDGPLGLDREQVRQFTDDPIGRASEALQDSDISLVSGAVLVGEVLAGGLLALVLTFLFLKDGRRFQDWVLAHLPARHHDAVRAGAGRAWAALGGYLRGAAILGAVEGVVIGTTVWLAGGALAVPVAVLTFAAAFFPVVGAVVAGAVATLVVLATAGPAQALVVLAVVIVVQQLDNDLLAPFIYGRSVQLHPALVLLALSAGGVLGGIVGAFVAVPVLAVVAAVGSEVWERRSPQWLAPDETSPTAEGPEPPAAPSPEGP
jgi:predicted PurR-regulated permease PerM